LSTDENVSNYTSSLSRHKDQYGFPHLIVKCIYSGLNELNLCKGDCCN
jgi:hypothetical protein